MRRTAAPPQRLMCPCVCLLSYPLVPEEKPIAPDLLNQAGEAGMDAAEFDDDVAAFLEGGVRCCTELLTWLKPSSCRRLSTLACWSCSSSAPLFSLCRTNGRCCQV